MSMPIDPTDPMDGMVNSMLAGLSFAKQLVASLPPGIHRGIYEAAIVDAEKEMELFLIDHDMEHIEKASAIMQTAKDLRP